MGTFSLGVKRLEHDADHSLSSSVKVRNERSCASAPHVCFHEMYRDFTFTDSSLYSVSSASGNKISKLQYNGYFNKYIVICDLPYVRNKIWI
jgi:hypothetical protein